MPGGQGAGADHAAMLMATPGRGPPKRDRAGSFKGSLLSRKGSARRRKNKD